MRALARPLGRRRLPGIVTLPGASRLIAATLLGRLPLGMVPLAILLLVRESGGSYAHGGAVVGAYALGLAICQPSLGRALDRWGRTGILRALGILFPLAIGGLAAATSSGAPTSLQLACAVLVGAALPPVGACMRALWPRLLHGSSQTPAQAYTMV